METIKRVFEATERVLTHKAYWPTALFTIAVLIGVRVKQVQAWENLSEAEKNGYHQGVGPQAECLPCDPGQTQKIQEAKDAAQKLVSAMQAHCKKNPSVGICEKIADTKKALDIAISHTDYTCGSTDITFYPAQYGGTTPVRILAITESTATDSLPASVCIYPAGFSSNLAMTLVHEGAHSVLGESHGNGIEVIEQKLYIADAFLRSQP